MSYLVLKERDSEHILPVKLVNDAQIAQTLLQPMRWKLLEKLSDGEQCAKDLAKKTGASEQVVCYHLKELEKQGFIKLERTEKRRGATAKFYSAQHRALAVTTHRSDATPTPPPILQSCQRLLSPFVNNGKFSSHIVIGSPDAHGIFRSRARCGHRAADIALFLGSLLPITRDLTVRLDTEITQPELSKDLIVIGGPRVNTVAMMINQWLPITYELTGQNMMMSTISSRSYSSEDEGAIQMIPNPMNPERNVAIIAGNSYLGTHAAVTAFVKHTEKVSEGNAFNSAILARIVSGVDLDSDGLIDDVEFLE